MTSHAETMKAALVAALTRDFMMRVSLADVTYKQESAPDMFTFTLNNRNRVSSATALVDSAPNENYVLSVACTLHDKILEQL